MQAFYTIRNRTVDAEGANTAAFPANFSYYTLHLLADMFTVNSEGHKHVLAGTIALGTNHGHWAGYVSGGQTLYQEHFGGGAAHSHPFPLEPNKYLCFVTCSDAEYTQLLIDAPNIIILGFANCTEDPENPGSFSLSGIDNTVWDGATRTAWENIFAGFGLTLPVVIDNSRRLVRFILATFHAHRQGIKAERSYRPRSITLS